MKEGMNGVRTISKGYASNVIQLSQSTTGGGKNMRNRLTIKHYTCIPTPGARLARQTIRERIRQFFMGRRYVVVSQSRVTSLDHAYNRLREWPTKEIIQATWFDRNCVPIDLVRHGDYIDQQITINVITKSLVDR